MKNVLFVAAGLMLLTSCFKERTCTCTYANGTPGYTESYTTTKKDAQAQCDDNEYAGVSCTLN
jgi:hypothetical protein